MISDTYPHNRLQELQLKRKVRPLFIFAAFICVWALTIFLTPVSYAYNPATANPSGAPEFPNTLPTAFVTAGCTGTACNTRLWGPCHVFSIGAVRTCLYVGPITSTGTIANQYSGQSVQNPYVWPTTKYSKVGYYSSGTWTVATNNSSISNGVTGIILFGDFRDSIATNVPLATGNGAGTDGSLYWFQSTYCNNNEDNTYHFLQLVGARCPNYNTLLLAQNLVAAPAPLQFINLTGTGGDISTTFNFKVAWTAAYTGALLTGKLYPTSSGTGSLSSNVVYFTPQKQSGSHSGSVLFSFKYKIGGTFRPLVSLSSCGGEGYTDSNGNFHEGSFTSTGAFIPNGACITTYLTGALISIGGSTTDFDVSIPQSFHPVTIAQGYSINTGIPFSYSVNSTICTSGSITGRKYFGGLPASFSQYDQGTDLNTNSGSGSLFYANTSQQMGGNPTPYIQVTCSNGGTPRVYMQNTLYSTRALSLFLFSTAQVVNPVLQTGTKGGKSTDYNGVTGSGAYFYTNSDTYSKLESVVARVYFKVNFTVGSVVVCPDPTQLSGQCVTLTASQYLTNATEHLYTFSYSATGQYYPRIQVRSSAYDANDSTTYRYIWLGGNTTKNPEGYLTVSDIVINSNGFQTTLGIFGLDPSTFNVSFGDNQNQFLQFLSFILTYVLKGALYVASYAFWALQQAPFFDFINTSIAPPAGSVWYVPTSINGIPLPHILSSGSSCTVHYATDAQGAFIFKVLQISLAGAIVGMFFRKFL